MLEILEILDLQDPGGDCPPGNHLGDLPGLALNITRLKNPDNPENIGNIGNHGNIGFLDLQALQDPGGDCPRATSWATSRGLP